MNCTARMAVIVNPTAGRGAAAKALPRIRKLLAAGFGETDIVYYLTAARGEAEELARIAIAAGASLVVAVGGDGTLHEVANAILETAGEEVVLGLIPFGTGNDFARGVGLRGDLGHVTGALAGGVPRGIDIGEIDGAGLAGKRRFLVAAGIGFVADTARTVNEGVRGLTGPAAYIYGAVKTLRGFSPVELTVSFDGKPPETLGCMLMSISNVATTGGGIKIAPDARPDDGLFDVCLVSQISKAKLLSKLPAAFAGKHVDDPAVTMLRASRVEVGTRTPCQLWIDGEVQGETPAKFTIRPGALRMMLPASYRPAP